jgi:hypothetical protein
MRIHVAAGLLPLLEALALASGHPQALATPASTISVGTDVQVSASRPETMHGEGMIAANPRAAAQLIACSVLISEDVGQTVAVYRSRDAGQHWQRTFQLPPAESAADPACTFGPDGIAYLAFLPFAAGSMAATRLPVWRSSDGGGTWQAVGTTGGMDRASIAVDAGSPRYGGRIYVHGTVYPHGTGGMTRTAVALYTSTDGGRSFGRPATWTSFDRGYILGCGGAIVLSDGRWVGIFPELKRVWDDPLSAATSLQFSSPPPEPENAWLQSIASEDGGDSLEEPVAVSGWHLPNDYVRMTSIVPAIAADATDGPFKDRIYVAWPDSRRGGTDILLSYSADRGRTWSAPIAINDESPHQLPPPNHLEPAIAVNGAGVVAVSWLDRRDAADGLGWRPRVRVSLDGGETFLPSVRLSGGAAQFDGREHWPAQSGTRGGGTPVLHGGLLHVDINAPRFLYIPGDYAGLTADANGTFHPYWIDNRTGWHQIWTAPVGGAARAVRNGSESLSSLDDLTALTTLKRIASHYDRESQTASVTVRVQNTSQHPIDGPFTVRLITLRSDVAIVDAAGSANGFSGPGATWVVQAGRLAPGDASDPVTLTFTLRDVRPFVQGHTDHFDLRLVSFDARVLGHRTDSAMSHR